MAEQKILISIQVKTGKSNQQIKATTKSLDQLATTQKKVSTGTDEMRATSGLNNAILMETGRLASDASFGFTAIANNLSQLVNLFKSSKDATGSYKESIKSLLTAQAAFLVGIQLLITFGDDLYRKLLELVKGSQFVKEALKDAGSMVESTAGNFEMYVKTLQDSNKSQQEQSEAIHLLNKEFPEYVQSLKDADLSLKDVSEQTEEAIRLTDLHREAIIKLAKSEAAKQKIQQLSGEQTQAEIDLDNKLLKLGENFDEKRGKDLQARRDEIDVITKSERTRQRKFETSFTAEEKGLIAAMDKRDEVVKKRQEEIDMLMQFVDLEINTEKKGYGRKEKDFKQHLLDLEKLEESYRQKAVDTEMMTSDEIIDQEEKNAKNELRIRVQSFKDRQKLRLEEFEEGSKLRETEALKNITDEGERKKIQDKFINERISANDEYNESIRLADVEHDEVMIQLEESFETKRAQLQRKRFSDAEIEQEKVDDLEKKQLDSRAANLDAIDQMGVKQAFNTRARNIERLKEDEAMAQMNVDKALEGTEIKAQAELDLLDLKRKIALEEQALEQEKFDFINEQYTKVSGMITETLDVTAHNQIVRIEETYNREMQAAEGNAELQTQIREKMEKDKDKIARRQFKIDKAARIGRAIMNTYESAWLAFGSQLIPAAPGTLPNAYVAQRIALISGLANVANIARQKYQGSVSAGGGGGAGGSGGGMQIQAPDFNVVGASQTSQLAQAVTTQQEKPVKAFVVGKDISTQQELDRNITNTASFG